MVGVGASRAAADRGPRARGALLGLLLLMACGAAWAGTASPAGARPNGGWGAAWSPRGDRLAFLSSQEGLPPDAWLTDPGGRSFRRLTHGGADQLAWSPDGRALSFLTSRRGRAERWRVEVATGRESPIPSPTGVPAEAPWLRSPDGRSVAYLLTKGKSRDLYLIGPGRKQPLRVTSDFAVGSFCWSPDSTKLAFDGTNPLSHDLPQVWAYDLARKKLAHLGTVGSYGPVWSPKGDLLVYGMMYSDAGDRVATATPEGKLGRLYTTVLYQREGLAWSPRSGDFAAAVQEGKQRQVWVMDEDGSVVAKLAKRGLAVRYPVWSPDGRRVAFEGLQQGISAASEVWVTDAAGKQWHNLTPCRPSHWALGRSRSGPVFFLTNVADVAKVGVAGSSRSVLSGTNGARSLAVSPQSDWVAVCTSGALSVLSAAGKTLSSWALPAAHGVQWSRQGNRLAVEAGDAGKGTVKILSVSAAGKLAEAGSVVGQGPVWRPDGRAVTFVRGADVWQADAKGEHAVQIATLPSAKGEQVALSRLSYAPTGDALVVAVVRTNASGPHQELWVLRGKQLREIHSDPVATEFGLAPERYGALPAWAGERILFSSDRDGAPRVWSIRADGSGLRAITPANSVWAALAPGGASLVFVRPDADAPLWKVSPDGSGLASIQWKKTR